MEFLIPAKINLSLVIKGRRRDGFHEIETLMVPVSIFDKLEVAHSSSGELEFVCDDPSLPTDDTNLVISAAKKFCVSFGFQTHLRLVLNKEIPHGAGLGGGSSDAAATLIALDRLFETRLSRESLFDLAAGIGSDVPFFLAQSAAVCRGRGELVSPVNFPHALPLLLIKPTFGVPTPWAYKRWHDSKEIPGVPYQPQPFSWGAMVNDLERPVFEKYLFLAELKRWLLEQPEVAGALMSGSGSTVFALLKDSSEAKTLTPKVSERFGSELWCHECQTISRV